MWDSKFVAIESFRRIPFILAFAFIASLVIRTTLLLDPNKHVFSHKPGKCKLFAELATGGAAYFENVEPLRYLFASDGFHRLSNSTHNAGIYFTQYPKNNPPQQKQQSTGQQKNVPKDEKFIKAMQNLKFQRLIIIGSEELLRDFTPLGIGSYIEGSISQNKFRLYLYIVNSPPKKQNRVEVFVLKPKELKLVHQFTVENRAFTSLSNIVVLSAGRFLVSNVFYFSNRWLQLAEFMTQREYGSILMYDGKEVNPLISGLQTPNGLFWEPVERRLYVSLTNAETVKIYHVKQDMSITELSQLNLMSSPDQLYFNKRNGELWLTAHPITHQLLRLSSSKSRSASHVLRVRFQGGLNSWVITEPFANNGSMLGTASAITLIDDYLLVGGRLSKTISCHINDLLYA